MLLNCYRGDYKVSQILVGAFKGSTKVELVKVAINQAQQMGVDVQPGELKIIGMSAIFGASDKKAKRAGHKALGKKFEDLNPETPVEPVKESVYREPFQWSESSPYYESVESAKDRFEKNFNKPTKGCWLWTGAKDKDGYGAFWYNGGSVRAIRFAWELYGGESLKGHPGLLCHTCQGTKNCVKKSHMYLGTHQTNMDDRLGKTKHKPD